MLASTGVLKSSRRTPLLLVEEIRINGSHPIPEFRRAAPLHEFLVMNGKKTERGKPVQRWDVDGRFASNADNILLLSVSVRPKRRQAYSLVCPTKFISISQLTNRLPQEIGVGLVNARFISNSAVSERLCCRFDREASLN